jgi:thiosulfate dehydrogenase (quinone) large subunit
MTDIGLKALAALRVVVGAAFLYAGIEKLLGATPFTAAGFLTHGTAGVLPDSATGAIVNPTHDLWVALAGNATLLPIVNSAVVLGEVAIGACLIVGLFTRFAGLAGALMMGLFTIAAYSFANGLFNETFMYAVIALYLAAANAGHAYGLDAWIPRLPSRDPKVSLPPTLRPA